MAAAGSAGGSSTAIPSRSGKRAVGGGRGATASPLVDGRIAGVTAGPGAVTSAGVRTGSKVARTPSEVGSTRTRTLPAGDPYSKSCDSKMVKVSRE